MFRWVQICAPLHPLFFFRNLYHYIGGDTSALTKGAASELIRNDGFAFLYAKPGPLPPLSPVFRRNTRLSLHHGPGSFVNSSDYLSRESVSYGFPRICRVQRVRRVIRVIRVMRVRIEKVLLRGYWKNAIIQAYKQGNCSEECVDDRRHN